MKAHIKIPKGWRRLRTGHIDLGDLVLCGTAQKPQWAKIRATWHYYADEDFIIRRIKRTKKGTK